MSIEAGVNMEFIRCEDKPFAAGVERAHSSTHERSEGQVPSDLFFPALLSSYDLLRVTAAESHHNRRPFGRALMTFSGFVADSLASHRS